VANAVIHTRRGGETNPDREESKQTSPNESNERNEKAGNQHDPAALAEALPHSHKPPTPSSIIYLDLNLNLAINNLFPVFFTYKLVSSSN